MIGLTDNDDRVVALLEQIASAVDDGTGDPVVNQTINVDKPDQTNTPELFSTGTERYGVADGDGWVKLEFGFVARTINVRTTDDILLAFTRQGMQNGGQAKIRSDESPFTIGGDAGIDSAFLWIKKASTASADPGVEILAYR